ncbi:uncharacterized protein LOC108669334 isoform X2 [Hyalella azteca]|uniref:Uncharacterized protein LOC108669334 isoform X2 n=1 Tax=Hyalella azteca TaxID=294128 RepID=A0A8B7NEU5_HYAAZ|nr:uncharacterized protein LOC108669334 isoform X2 [Hyalella azteca]
MTKMNNGKTKPKGLQVDWTHRTEHIGRSRVSLYKSVLLPSNRANRQAFIDDMVADNIGHDNQTGINGFPHPKFDSSNHRIFGNEKQNGFGVSKSALIGNETKFQNGVLIGSRETNYETSSGRYNAVSARSSVDLLTSEEHDLIAGVSKGPSLVTQRRRTLASLTELLHLEKYRYTGAGKKARKRIVQKNGECNVTVANVARRRRRYLQDIFTTLVDIKWRWTLMVFAMSFILSWLVFAVVWWLIVFLHGDLKPDHLPHNQEKNNWSPCVVGIISFTSCFLFSIETQHTIGYGSRHTTEECPHAIVVMCLQSITGVVIQAFMVGIIFAKLSRPKKRTQTLIFSRKMCILQRDGQLCLMFRVGDIRKSHIIEAHVRAQLIRKHVTQEGEEIPLHMYDLDVGYDVGEDRIFFIWPMTIVHKIDEGSPLYDLSASSLQNADFEIVVLLEGVIESTGMTTQARSSYLPDEILWGHRFQPLVSYKKSPREGFYVDLSLFNNTQPVCTPSCSARELDEARSDSASTGAGGPDLGQIDEKEADGGSEHSSQVTMECPLSPHSVDTMAAAPLMSPSHTTDHFTNSNVISSKKSRSFGVNSDTIAPSISQRNLLYPEGDDPEVKCSAFTYEIPARQNDPEPVVGSSHRHSIASPSRYQVESRQDLDIGCEKERTYRRAISQQEGIVSSLSHERKNNWNFKKENNVAVMLEVPGQPEEKKPCLVDTIEGSQSLSSKEEGISYARGHCSSEPLIREEPASPSDMRREWSSSNEGEPVFPNKLNVPSTSQNNKFSLSSNAPTEDTFGPNTSNDFERAWADLSKKSSTPRNSEDRFSSPSVNRSSAVTRRCDRLSIV